MLKSFNFSVTIGVKAAPQSVLLGCKGFLQPWDAPNSYGKDLTHINNSWWIRQKGHIRAAFEIRMGFAGHRVSRTNLTNFVHTKIKLTNETLVTSALPHHAGVGVSEHHDYVEKTLVVVKEDPTWYLYGSVANNENRQNYGETMD